MKSAITLLFMVSTAGSAAAQFSIDGTVAGDPYGPPASVQAVQTQFGDNFSEWNAAYCGIDAAGSLVLALTGNLEGNFNKLEIFIDSVPGGEQVFSGFPGNDGSGTMAGFAFEVGFLADFHLIARRGFDGFTGGDKFDLDIAALGTPNFSSHIDVFGGTQEGSGTTGTGPGNSQPIDVAYDNANLAGVLGGCDPADQVAAAGVETGLELRISLADLGNPTGDLRILVFQNSQDHGFTSNQFLGPLTPPQCNLGTTANIDLNVLPGDQFFTCLLGCTDNDTCVCAEEIAGNGLFDFDTTAASQDGPGDPACDKFGTSQIDNDVWFAWTPDTTCDYAISTVGLTSADTKLAIYDTDDCGALVGSIIDCNDDTVGVQSTVFGSQLTAGTTYLIRIGSFPGALGTMAQFSIEKSNCALDNNFCDQCEPISGLGAFAFDTTAATQDGVGNPACDKFGTSQIDNDVWFCYTPECSGTYSFTTVGQTSADTKLALYDGTDCPEGSGIIDCNDDTVGVQSTVSGSLVGGNSYLLRVGSFPGALGTAANFVVSGPATGASNYCVAGVNQDGEQTILKLTGSERISDNNLEICANDVSSMSRFGLFVFGDTQQQMAFGQGFLCVGLGGNFNRLLPIENYNMVNQVCKTVDLTAPPADIITAGSTWNFQFWYRDFGQTNLSDGLSICFTP